MKLVSVNMEGMNHILRIVQLITREQPDCICLLEAPENFMTTLTTLGYQSVFAFMQKRSAEGIESNEGVIFASRYPYAHHTNNYYEIGTKETPQEIGGRFVHTTFPYIFASISHPTEGKVFVATTHFIVTADGLADADQTAGLKAILAHLHTEAPHVLCGDFNLPRGVNTLYPLITNEYTDTIPPHYTSSLDRTLHRLGASLNLNAPIFDKYIVDYIFTKPPYHAENVRLQFGVSDHAAVIADIVRTT